MITRKLLLKNEMKDLVHFRANRTCHVHLVKEYEGECGCTNHKFANLANLLADCALT